jgi:flagellar motility protein MotE (MotC chaperone)
MNDVLAMVLVWQVVLLGGWAVSRRLRRLERSLQPPCYAQVGALREQVVGLRNEQALDAGDLAQRARDVEESVAHMEDELRTLSRQQEKLSRVLLERIRELEERLTAEMAARTGRRLASSGS